MPKNIIIDGSNLIHRNYHVFQKSEEERKTSSDGVSDGFNVYAGTSNFYAFILQSLAKLKSDKEDRLYIVWDRKLHYAPTFRQDILEGQYKANRERDVDKEAQLDEYVNGIWCITGSLGIKNVFPYSKFEGDDVMAWLSKNLPGKTTIVSSDKDLCQLINENVSVFNPLKKNVINTKNFSEHLGIEQQYFVMLKSIVGDAGDNIKGVNKIGPVRGTPLARKFIDCPEELEKYEHRDLVKRNLTLTCLNYSLEQHPQEVEMLERQIGVPCTFDKTKFEHYCQTLSLDSKAPVFSKLKFEAASTLDALLN